jgi:hypothetical protein
MHYISVLSTIVAFAFGAAVLSRYAKKGGTHLLLWGIGVILFGLGTLSEVVFNFGFNQWFLKIWYLTGAMLTAAWLGEGTVHLLVRKRGVANIITAILAVVSLIAIALVLMAPINSAAAAAFVPSRPVSVQYQDILVRNGGIILLTILLNIYGTLALVGGAAYSALLFWRKHVLASRMVGNILIAVGAMMPAMGGTFTKAGLPDWLYLSEFIGVILMYLGFMQATAGKPVKEKKPAEVPASAD